MKKEKPKVIIVLGPTGVGKSKLALELAQEMEAEIISADSMQIYKYMDIGTAKPSLKERNLVKHHLIDLIYPDQEFSAAQFREEAEKIIFSLKNQDKKIIVVGGSGLYIKTLTQGLFKGPGADQKLRKELKEKARLKGKEYLYEELKKIDPLSAARLHPYDLFRVTRALEVFFLTGETLSSYQQAHQFKEQPFELLKLGLMMERNQLYLKLEKRVDGMIKEGLVEEVKFLLEKGYGPELKSMQALGYRHISDYFKQKYGFDQTIRLLKRDTKRYAKRQFTWFNADREINWFSFPFKLQEISCKIKNFLII